MWARSGRKWKKYYKYFTIIAIRNSIYGRLLIYEIDWFAINHTHTRGLLGIYFISLLPIAINEKVVYVKCAQFERRAKKKNWWELIEANGIDRMKKEVDWKSDFFYSVIAFGFKISIVWNDKKFHWQWWVVPLNLGFEPIDYNSFFHILFISLKKANKTLIIINNKIQIKTNNHY